MSKICDVCGKQQSSGHKVSHSHKSTNRRWFPNLQRVKVKVDGGGFRRIKVCTSCIRSERILKSK